MRWFQWTIKNAKPVIISDNTIPLTNGEFSGYIVVTVLLTGLDAKSRIQQLAATIFSVPHRRRLLYPKNILARNCFSICCNWSCCRRLNKGCEFEFRFLFHNSICTSVHIPTGCVRMRMDSPTGFVSASVALFRSPFGEHPPATTALPLPTKAIRLCGAPLCYGQFSHQCAHWCRPFESLYPNTKNADTRMGICFWEHVCT